MPTIIEAHAISVGNRTFCVLFLDEWPKGPMKGIQGEVEGERFELDSVFLDGGGKIHDEPRVGIEITSRSVSADWFAGKEMGEI